MIDRYHRRPWPNSVKEALERFKQGDLIENPVFFYGIAVGSRIWGPEDDEDEEPDGPGYADSRVEEWHPDDPPPWAIITTQTCDISERGEPSQPWVQVCPVYSVEEYEEEELARLLRKAYIVELTGNGLPEGRRWVVDLRIELPLEKTVLVEKNPIAGFATENEAEEFGRLLGRRRARPALADDLVNNVTRLIGRKKSNNRNRAAPVWDELYKLGLQIEEGTRLKPVAVRLHVICAGEPSDLVRAWFTEWEDNARAQAADVGITLHTTRCHDARSMDVTLADRLTELDVP